MLIEATTVRPLLKLAFLLTLIFAACIGLIRAQPYDDSELRAFLTPPDGCPMPCFMGIRPGVTTADEAVAILEAHEWVSAIEVVSDPASQIGAISLYWSTLSPELISKDNTGGIYLKDNIVRGVFVDTNVSFGEIWQLFGKPSIGGVFILGQPTGLIQHAGYPDTLLSISSGVPCPVHLDAIWRSTIAINFSLDVQSQLTQNDYQFSDWLSIQPCI